MSYTLLVIGCKRGIQGKYLDEFVWFGFSASREHIYDGQWQVYRKKLNYGMPLYEYMYLSDSCCKIGFFLRHISYLFYMV